LLPSDLPDKYTDDLMRIVDDELFTISSKQAYPMARSKVWNIFYISVGTQPLKTPKIFGIFDDRESEFEF
jgi:hypothetical protein